MAEYDRNATGPLPVDAGPRRAENIFDMSPEDFRASLGEMQALGHDTDALMRQYRARNSPFAPINNAAAAQQQDLADSGRRSVLGGFASKPEGATGWDAITGLEFEGLLGLFGAGQAIGQGLDAPAAAYQGVMPDQDVNMEALNTAGMAMGAGGAATAPSGALRSGLAREAGLSEAQRQARDILDMRAAGRAGDVTDDMMARADDQYMFDNTPLPMDEASRAARAQAGGFDTGTPLFHGGDSGISAMDPDVASGKDYDTGVWTTSDPYNANRYAGSRTEGVSQNVDDLGSVYPLLADTSGYGITDFRGRNWGDAPERAAIRGGGQPYQEISKIREDWASWPYTGEAVRAARDTGRTGLDIRNVVDIGDQFPHKSHIGLGDETASSVVAIDPTTLRSRFARFDPEFSHLSNLSAANASPTAGLLASGAQEQDKPLPFMEMLRGLLQ